MSISRSRRLLACALLGLSISFALYGETSDSDQRFKIDRAPLDRTESGDRVSYASSIAIARPSVVSVYAKSFAEYSREELMMQYLLGVDPKPRGESFGLGSGVIVSADGYILTNHHVVDGATELKVQLDNDRIYDARIVGSDKHTDVAVIKIDASKLPQATIADSDAIEIGDVVFAIGNPLGVGKTVTMGIVSAKGRHALSAVQGSYEDFIQTDAPINPGNSGGALIDATGRLIGLNTLIRTDRESTGNIGIGFAVPINLAYGVMKDLIDSGTVNRGYLGVNIEPLDEEKAKFHGVDTLQGALVDNVNPGSPAAAAGIKDGDVIVAIDGKPINSPNDLRLTIAQLKPGTEIEVRYIRDRNPETATAILAPLGEAGKVISLAPIRDSLLDGVTLETISDELKTRYDLDESIEGVVVTKLSPNCPYKDKLAEGMVILRVNKPKVASPAAVSANLVSGERNQLYVCYRGVYRWITFEIESGE